MKKLLSIIAFAVFALGVNAQVIPASELPFFNGFEDDDYEFDSWIDGSGNWSVENSVSYQHCSIQQAYAGEYFAMSVSESSDTTYSSLETYAFELPIGTPQVKLSFWYALPTWGYDYDELYIGMRSSGYGEYEAVKSFTDSANAWTYVELFIPVDDNTIQFEFKALNRYGYGVFLDNIKVEAMPLITSFPWCEDFESGNLNNLTVYHDTGIDYTWTIEEGCGHDNGPDEAYSGSHNAVFFVDEGEGERATLLTPFFDLRNADSATLTFAFLNADWQGDYDELYVYTRDMNKVWTILEEYDEAVDDWTIYTVNVPVGDIVQIGFEADSYYGYGILLDDICLNITSSVGVQENENASIFSVYPNPANDYIIVNRTGNDEVFIYNAMGSLVKSSNENRINISNLAPGFYTVKTTEGTAKIVVE